MRKLKIFLVIIIFIANYFNDYIFICLFMLYTFTVDLLVFILLGYSTVDSSY